MPVELVAWYRWLSMADQDFEVKRWGGGGGGQSEMLNGYLMGLY